MGENLWSKISAKRSQKFIARNQRRNSIMISRPEQDLSKIQYSDLICYHGSHGWICTFNVLSIFFMSNRSQMRKNLKGERTFSEKKSIHNRQKSSVNINLPHQYVDKLVNFILRLVWTGKNLLNLHELVLNHLKTSYNVMSYAISYSSILFEFVFYLKILRIRHFLLR